MPKLIAFLLVCLMSLGASAQDVKLSFGSATLSAKETNTTTSAQLQKNSKLVAETPGYKVVSYVISFLPKKDDLVGPFKITEGQEYPQIVKNFLPRAGGSKIFMDDILVQGPDGKKFKSRSYIVVCQ